MSDWMSTEALLTEGYRRCAKLTWRYGTTYFWGAALLPKPQRRDVYAVYALCRLADDIVDLPGATESRASGSVHISAPTDSADISDDGIPREADRTLPEPIEDQAAVGDQLEAFADEFRTSLAVGSSTDPVMAAVIHTVITRRIDPECFDRFFNAMAMDLTTSSYSTWEDLRDYMEGSAAVIGEMMLPVLEPISDAAKQPARSLGLAFQLTNFLRDVNEDLDRGRIYLPQDDLRLFDVDLERRAVTPQWRAFLAYEIERNRALYSFADTGIALLPPRSARCVGTARVLYAQILDQIERNDYDVFSSRARVPTNRKAATAARIMVTGPRTLKRQAEDYQRRSMTDVTQDTY
jgi:15-cis-phytoene synthase